MKVKVVNNTINNKRIKKILKQNLKDEKDLVSVKVEKVNTINAKALSNAKKSSAKRTVDMVCKCNQHVFNTWPKVDGHIC